MKRIIGVLLMILPGVWLSGCVKDKIQEPSKSSIEAREIFDYKLNMQSTIEAGNAVIEEYNELVKLWNSSLLNPPLEYFKERFEVVSFSINFQLGRAKNVTIANQKIADVHKYYVEFWELMQMAAQCMVTYFDDRSPELVVQANIHQNNAEKKRVEFNAKLASLR